MRRLPTIFLSLAMALSVGACNSGDSSSGGNDGGGLGDVTVDGASVDAGSPADGASGDAGITKTYSIGGNVSGLAGSGLTLKSGTESLAISASGTFTFKTPLASGAAYAITIATQPTSPTQTCTVANGVGTIGAANVTSVAVTCTTTKLKIGGTVAGLAGSGLVLQDNNGDDLSVTANGAFAFPTSVDSGNAFSVSVKTQPDNPSQTCVVTGGTGTVGSADVTSVMVNCTTGKFAIGGQISGLSGAVVLQNSGGDDLTVTSNGTFAFPSLVTSGGAYAVTVKTQPSSPTQSCIVTSGGGTVASAAITSVQVTCTTTKFTVGGTVSGLSGSGLVLQDNAGDNLAISASGAFTFATSVASGAGYAVTVLAQPSSPTQTCTVTNGASNVGGANVTDVSVNCVTSTYTIGGTVTGLAGSGLVLQDAAGDDLAVTSYGTFTFLTPIASGAPYAVTLLTQPGSPLQTCSVSGATGIVTAGNVTSVAVNCTTDTFTVGGTISGLAGTVVLQDNGGDDLTVTTNGTFAFSTPVASGQAYAITVKSQPGAPSQTCVVANGTGSIDTSAVSSVAVTCTTNTFSIGGTVTGLAATESVVLQDNNGDNLTVSANGTFTFATSIASGATYGVTTLTNPASPLAQTCVVDSGSGTVAAANVGNVNVTCTTNTYAVGGNVTGLVGAGLVLRDNGGDDLTVTSNGAFHFATKIASGGTYAVTTLQNPTSPSQTCVVSSGTGGVTNADIASVSIACTTNTYSIGGSVSGLAAGNGLVLQNNAGNNTAINANGPFTFSTKIASNAAYAVTILSQSGATAQTCTVSGGTGTVGAGNVTGITINCTTNTYTVGVTVSGLTGGSVVLANNGGNNLTVSGNGTFAFSTPIASGSAYAVTVVTNPAVPAQTCVIANGSGTIGSANVTNVTLTCTKNTYSVGGTVSGLAAGDTLVLQDNGADNATLNANGGFTFATKIPSGSTYTVSVLSSPSSPISQTCAVTSGAGTITNANVTNVTVTCTTKSYSIGVTVSGMTGTGLVLRDNGADNLTINANGGFTFATAVASGSAYSVTTLTQPTGQTCTVTNGSGTVGSANVVNVTVVCAGPHYNFGLSQVIDGQTVTCSAVSTTATYTECDDLRQGGRYFPNGISCGPIWSSTNSSYSDTAGFCQSLTGSSVMQAYYVCTSTQPRSTWTNHVWGTFNDNGYTQHVRCYF